MSLFLKFLNPYLRLTEKRQLRHATSEEAARRAFEFKARISFFAPRGSRFKAVKLGGVPALEVTVDGAASDLVILYFHGGAYVIGSPNTHKAMLAKLAKKAGARAVLPDYRLAPEHPFPAAVDDAVAAYNGLLATGTAPENIILSGDSAGGGLVLALLGEICRKDLPKPLGCFTFSPWTDLTFASGSLRTNAEVDVVLPVQRLEDTAAMVLAGADPTDPRITPLNADFTGAPPVWITVGDTEVLLDDATRMAAHLRAQGVAVTEVIEHDLPHVWPLFHNWLPEARATMTQVAAWIGGLAR